MEKTTKVLGKIEQVEFGIPNDRPYLFGLTLCLATSESSGVVTHIFANMRGAKWHNEYTEVIRMNKEVYNLLESAKVQTIDELVGKPVEMIFKEDFVRTLVSFRILTEVL